MEQTILEIKNKKILKPRTFNRIIKFGGKSLDNGAGIEKVLQIILNQKQNDFAVVVSARGTATDDLLALIQLVLQQNKQNDHLWETSQLSKDALESEQLFQQFKWKQQGNSLVDLTPEFERLKFLLKGISLLGECPPKTKDKILSLGEVISAKWISYELAQRGFSATAVDAGEFFITNSQFGNAQINHTISTKKTIDFFEKLNAETLPVVTGFIAADENGERTILGRNGSNYSAALLANYLNAEIIENYTHVDGIFTADPNELEDARQINELSYTEAAELAQFGASILHEKTLEPLIDKSISLKILNIFGDKNQKGTLISDHPKNNRVRAVSSLSHKALIRFEGKGFLGKVGVDARIFSVLQNENISVGMVSQGSSERAIGLVIDESQTFTAINALKKEFWHDLKVGEVDEIVADTGLSVLAIIGLDLNYFDKAYNALIRNKIRPVLFNNSINGNTICLLLKNEEIIKAKHVIHGELFERPKRVHLAVVGHGTVGKTFINQVISQRKDIIQKKNTDVRIFAVANSTQTLFAKNGINEHWEQLKLNSPKKDFDPDDIINFANKHGLENLILVDNTANQNIAATYEKFVENGFDLVSSNKIANTLDLNSYRSLRETLEKNKKRYAYETNVGAGLPLIDTIRLLHLSGENIIKIKGVFSGSLSYIFNRFSDSNLPFSEVLLEAVQKGLTEPDPREDLNGNDVARKLLILARELDFEKELKDVVVQNLIPEGLRDISKDEFFDRLPEMDAIYTEIKANCAENHVLRYTGELQWDLKNQKGKMEVKLVETPLNSPLGQLRGSDSIFEIFTESYGDRPLVIQGAGAGAEVTARGVFGDVLRLSEGN